MNPPTLTGFLLARIAEDERDAIAIRDCEMFHGVDSDAEAEVLRLSDPARVLAECDAKRRIVGLHTDDDPSDCTPWGRGSGEPCDILAALALPYADHPDYQEAWKP